MAINFTDSPSNGDTQTINGRTYTYNSAKNKWDTTATEVAGPTAAVYATVNDLPGSATTGDQAFVSGTNRLYIWNGTGWYNIALVNNTPTWTNQPNSSYALAIDGTATTITIVATDPEGLPITYSIASDTSGTIATVTQGTGQQSNTWTITPSTSSADAGTFSLTFRASDGINVASAISSFTLQFKVANSNYTTALVTTTGSAGTNSTFTDSSSNSHTVTANGNAAQATFSPYRHGGYSTHFDGNADKIEFPQTTVIGTNDFTIEAWVYPEGFGATECIFCTLPSGSSTSIQLNVDTGGALELWYKGVSTTDRVNISNVFTLNTWHHIAVVGDGTANEIKIYKDGTQIGSTISYDYNYSASGVMRVGTNRGDVTYFDGYLRDVRLVHSKVYTANFTAPTEPLTAITNTKLLTCHLPYIVDGSSDANAATVSGDTRTEPFAPFDHQEYTVGDHGGSVYLDGTGDYLEVANSANFDFPSDFTLEFWINFDNTSWPSYLDITGNANNGAYIGSGRGGWIASYYDSSSTIKFSYQYNSSWVFEHSFVLSAGLEPDRWYHMAFTRESNSLKCFLNGQQVGSTITESTSIVSGEPLDIGTGYNGTGTKVTGSISDYRIVQGTAVYTANFTPPTAPLTAITNTSLLLNTQGAKILDKSQGAENLKLTGNTTASTAQYKHLPTSMYFNGTTDYITSPSSSIYDFGTGDYTLETWVRFADVTSTWQAIAGRGYQQTGGWRWYKVASSTNIQFYYSGTSYVEATNTGLTNDTWHHLAVVREGSNLTIYVDGTAKGTMSTWSGSNNPGNYELEIGAGISNTAPTAYWFFGGYMSDFRVTKGLARYTANFTPPSEALKA